MGLHDVVRIYSRPALQMQIYADITGMPLSTIGSTQGPALGSAIHAAVAAYEELFRECRTLHDYFGRGTNSLMHRFKAIQRSAVEP